MSSVNLSALDGSGYILQETNQVRSRTIHRYLLQNSTATEAIETAARCLQRVLEANEGLLWPVFPGTGVSNTVVAQNPYLVINGSAVCLSRRPKAPDTASLSLTDRFFSESLMQYPVKCSQGHSFEISFIQVWSSRKNNVCPVGEHLIGAIEVDEELQEKISRFERAERKQQEIEARVEEQIRLVEQREATVQDQLRRIEARETEVETQLALMRIRETSVQKREAEARLAEDRASVTFISAQLALSSYRKGLGLPVGRAVTKVVVTGGAEIVLKVGSKALSKGGSKSLGIVLKKIPIIAVFVGFGLGGYRLATAKSSADYIAALAEVVSGLSAGLFPGIGTGVSIGLDVMITGYDIYETRQEIRLDISIERALATLGLAANPAPSREDITNAFRRQSQLVHPDHLRQLGEYTEQDSTTLTQMLNQAREILMNHYHYA